MTTLAHAEMKRGAQEWEDSYPSAVQSGIVSDAEHLTRNTYHSGIEDLPDPNGFSNTRPDDRAPPGTWPRNLSSATDMSMSKADMIADWNRMKAVWSDRTDPRRNYLNAYNGWDGVGNAKRLDFVSNTIGTATNDHQWHGHEEKRRRYANDPTATNAVASIHMGWTKEQWISGGAAMADFAKFGQTGDNVLQLQGDLDFCFPGALNPNPDGTPGAPATGLDGKFGETTKKVLARAMTEMNWGVDGANFTQGEHPRLAALIVKRQLEAMGWVPGDGGGGAGPHKHDTKPSGISITVPAQSVTIQMPGFNVTGTAAAGETGGPEPM